MIRVLECLHLEQKCCKKSFKYIVKTKPATNYTCVGQIENSKTIHIRY